MHVIADIDGIPEADRPEVFRLTEVIMQATDRLQGVTPEARRDAEVALFAYAHQLSAEKRTNPTDDVWSILATGELDEFELDLFFMVLTFAGSETTRNALTQGMLALVDNPTQLDDLRRDQSLMSIPPRRSPPTGTRRCSPSRLASTSGGHRTHMSPLAGADRTSASAPASHALKSRR